MVGIEWTWLSQQFLLSNKGLLKLLLMGVFILTLIYFCYTFYGGAIGNINLWYDHNEDFSVTNANTFVRRLSANDQNFKGNRISKFDFDPHGNDTLVVIHIQKTGGREFRRYLVTVKRGSQYLCNISPAMKSLVEAKKLIPPVNSTRWEIVSCPRYPLKGEHKQLISRKYQPEKWGSRKLLYNKPWPMSRKHQQTQRSPRKYFQQQLQWSNSRMSLQQQLQWSNPRISLQQQLQWSNPRMSLQKQLQWSIPGKFFQQHPSSRNDLNSRISEEVLREQWLISEKTMGWVCGVHPSYTEYRNCLPNLKLAKFNKNRKLHYAVFLRHPVMRYISEYAHIVKNNATWASRHYCKGELVPLGDMPPCYPGFYDNVPWPNLTISDFLSCESNWANNRQTLMVADIEEANCFDKTSIDKEEWEMKLLDSAKKNLKSFAFFGLTEYIDESLSIFEDSFNMKFPSRLPTKNLSNLYSGSMVLNLLQSPEYVKAICEVNHLDMALYEYALRLFAERASRIGIKIDVKKVEKEIYSLTTLNFSKGEKYIFIVILAIVSCLMLSLIFRHFYRLKISWQVLLSRYCSLVFCRT